MESLTFKLEEFEGPLDLLLYLVGKNKMDLHEIAILDLIDQYTAVINTLTDHRLDVASEFIEMAARLVQMKSYLLLPRSEEAEAIAALDAGDAQAKALLIEHNLRLVVYIARRFENTGVNIEDLISIGTIGLIKAINTFNSGKAIKLATYASRCIENEILMYLRKNNAVRGEISIDEPLNTDCDGNELLLSDILGTDADEVIRPLEDDADREMLRIAIDTLPEREKQIILLRYGFIGGTEYTQKEVASLLGISQSYISRLEKRIVERLHSEMLKLAQ